MNNGGGSDAFYRSQQLGQITNGSGYKRKPTGLFVQNCLHFGGWLPTSICDHFAAISRERTCYVPADKASTPQNQYGTVT
jgi:hypothetical protein